MEDPVGKAPKLLDQTRACLRTKHYSLRTGGAYVDWVRRFVFFHQKRHPREQSPLEIQVFLTHLAVDRHASPSTQNQAKSALLFLYREVLQVDLPWLKETVQANQTPRLPVVLILGEVRTLLGQMDGVMLLVTRLLYGTGMRFIEVLCLRVKDIGFAAGDRLEPSTKGL